MEERAGLGLVSAMTSFSLANDDQLLALTLGARTLLPSVLALVE